MTRPRFTRFAVATLVATLAVILWGAFVRATGSGAGCGSHWPTCNGELVPRAASTATLIEYTHRITSGVALLLVVAQVVFARRTFAPGHFARKTAWAALFFMVTEALVGAGLVLFEKVAGDKSIARGYWMSAHLINTFLLVASMTLVVWAAKRDRTPALAGRARTAALVLSTLVALTITGVSGAIAALGDTLFPAKTLAEGLAADSAAGAHLFVELRVLHPFVAAATAIYVLLVGSGFARSKDAATRAAAQRTAVLVLAQVTAGIINLLFAAPTALQLVHLLLADLVWMSAVVLSAEALSALPERAAASKSAHQPSPTT